jgi:KUP system potassium uptake protein
MQANNKVPFSALGVVLAIGIVFGDIGTSPLYVMRAVLNSLPAGQLTLPEYILGAVS